MQETYQTLLFQVRTFYMPNLLCDLSVIKCLIEYHFVGVPPSLVACGAICCAVNSLLEKYATECRKTLANLTGIEQVCMFKAKKF